MSRISFSRDAIAALLLTGLLAGCATATPYQPIDNGYGYDEQRIEQNRYRIRFSGNARTPKQTVENYLLFRAAELTLQAGFDYFVFASEGTDANTRYLQSFNGFYGNYYWYPRPYWGVGAGASTATPITEYEAQASVVMFRGQKKDDDVKAFDARQVQSNLAPVIRRPQADGKS